MSTRTYPIILAHGFIRFDELLVHTFDIDNSPLWDWLHYFRGIRNQLRTVGFDVWHAHVDWARPVDIRSASLRRIVNNVLRKTKLDRVHIIGHSMGGLDARRMLFNYRNEGIADRVASVTTIGTPHHGSPVADFCIRHCPSVLTNPGFGLDGIIDLQTTSCTAFNKKAEDWEQSCGVRFQTYASTKSWPFIFAPLIPTWKLVESLEGPNDGLVSVNSAKWRDEYFAEPIPDMDHLNQIGWWHPTDWLQGVSPWTLNQRIRNLYVSIARNLASAFPL